MQAHLLCSRSIGSFKQCVSRHCAAHRHESVPMVVFSSLGGGAVGEGGGVIHCSASEIPISSLWRSDPLWIFLSPLLVAWKLFFPPRPEDESQRREQKLVAVLTERSLPQRWVRPYKWAICFSDDWHQPLGFLKSNRWILGACFVLRLKQQENLDEVWICSVVRE